MRKIVLLTVLIFLASAMLYPSDHWKSKGIDITDGVYQNLEDYNLQIETICKQLNLNTAPYNYNGIALSGYLKVGKGNSALGFIFYGKEGLDRLKLNTVPTILWLNGGPGSSSQLGNLMELGPFWLAQNPFRPYDIVRNNYTWAREYNLLFVDQPVGTGLSYADQTYPNVYPKNMTEVANDFYNALNQLYNNPNGCFNKVEIRGNNNLFLFGQSYAGKYVPAIAEKILREAAENKGFLTGLKGVAIGDGFTSPHDTLAQMGEYAYNFGLIDYQQRSKIEQIILNATYQELDHEWSQLHKSFNKVLNLITSSTGGVNVYDITKYRAYPTQLLDEYFGNLDIQKLYALDPSIKFNAQSGNVAEALYEDFMKNQVSLVQRLLIYHDVQVLVYTGQNDLICQTPGTFRWLERAHYYDSDKFRDTLFSVWKVGNRTAGYAKSAGNLELKTVNNAGHLVPMDQGEAALELVKSFINKSLPKEDIVIQDA